MSERLWMRSLIAFGILVRIAAVLILQSHYVPHSTYEHGEIAANILAGKGFSVRFLGADGPTSQQAPLYPYIVAAAFAIGGVETPRSLLLLELGQAVLGGWLIAETIRLAREIAPNRRGVAFSAGLIVAIHPTLVYASTHVQVAGLAAVLLTSVLARSFQATSTRSAVGVGVLLGGLILTDPILGLAAPGAVWIMLQGRAESARRSVILMVITAGIVVTPWIVRNAYVHGELVFVKSTFGYAFWQGNCKLSEGTDKVVRPSVERVLADQSETLRDLNTKLWAARHQAGYLDDVALTAEDYRMLGKVGEPERSRILLRRAIGELKNDPGRYVRLCLRRLRYFFLFDDTNPKTRNPIYRLSHLGLTVIAVIGLALAAPDVRRRLGPTILTVGLIAGFHTLTIVSARFHLPIEPIFAVWAGAGLSRFGRTTC